MLHEHALCFKTGTLKLNVQYNRKSETVHWFKATFHYHHVYVPLLIRLHVMMLKQTLVPHYMI